MMDKTFIMNIAVSAIVSLIVSFAFHNLKSGDLRSEYEEHKREVEQHIGKIAFQYETAIPIDYSDKGNNGSKKTKDMPTSNMNATNPDQQKIQNPAETAAPTNMNQQIPPNPSMPVKMPTADHQGVEKKIKPDSTDAQSTMNPVEDVENLSEAPEPEAEQNHNDEENTSLPSPSYPN